MTAKWVAASVRAEAMARRRYGAAAARTLAGSPSLDAALTELAGTPYGHDVRPGQSLAEAEHALAATVLWHLRVLAGWAPWEGTQLLRVLAGAFEIANVDDRLRSWADGATRTPFELGALTTAWSQLSRASSRGELREVLADSPWGDPGADTTAAIQLGLRVGWARRAAGRVPEAWRLGGVAVLLARERFAAGRRLAAPEAEQLGLAVGGSAAAATSLEELVAALPRQAAWPLEGLTGPADLWRAEAAWWRRVEDDGFRLLRSGRFDSSRLLGAAAVLAVDAWRVRAALQVAARGGAGLEVFDAVA